MSAADRLLIKPRRWAKPAPAPSTTGHFQGTHGQHDHESVDSTGADPYGEPTRNATPHSQHDHRGGVSPAGPPRAWAWLPRSGRRTAAGTTVGRRRAPAGWRGSADGGPRG